MDAEKIRNICIIAHVDHGKTTLVDHLLKQGGAFEKESQDTLIMDSGDLEREKGITIQAKNAAILKKGHKINIIDTPGHADFGGEVERIMSMADGAILLVDAAEGPLPQTRFVLEKAIKQGLRIILFINKVDRPEIRDSERINEVINETFDLFADLGASDEQIDFPIVYACGREGWCTTGEDLINDHLDGKIKGSLEPLYDLIIDYFPKPSIEEDQGFRMLIANLSYSEFVGQMGLGKIRSGKIRKNQRIVCHGVDEKGQPVIKSFTVTKLYTYMGLKQVDAEEAVAGDIALIAGYDTVQIGDTFTEDESVAALPRIKVDKPTIGMVFSVNASPFSGQEGEAIQTRKLRERLIRETKLNVALQFEETAGGEYYRILGRGELQFAILIEQMRREGLEFMVARPEVLFREGENGPEEPMELCTVDIPEEFAGDVTELLQTRKGIMTKYENINSPGAQRVRLVFSIPTRGLLGIRSRFMTITRGEGLLNSEFERYGEVKGEFRHRINGTLISDRQGEAVEYALLQLEPRGTLFIAPGTKVYEGMVIGECARAEDLDVNPCKEKKLTNVRSVNKDAFETLKGLRQMSLEQYIEWIEDDEWIEVTPENIRIRKKELSKSKRQTQSRKK